MVLVAGHRARWVEGGRYERGVFLLSAGVLRLRVGKTYSQSITIRIAPSSGPQPQDPSLKLCVRHTRAHIHCEHIHMSSCNTPRTSPTLHARRTAALGCATI
eukprot:scaffold40606_cov45-Tisochrysis_lutea.AAC.1